MHVSQYSKVDPGMLCASCSWGHVRQSAQGHTEILCKAFAEAATPVAFVVTECSDYMRKEQMRMWDKGLELQIVDGELQARNPVRHRSQDPMWINARMALGLTKGK